ncbi:MAG: hypothetical protein VYE40_11325 [Myxococcota bacterium]|nr:hypothetical protein [Myxococcota bacterium]MEC9441685.1 hypothetical protein [Myxococcota bacterium]
MDNKKIGALLLITMLCACGGGEEENNAANNTSANNNTQEASFDTATKIEAFMEAKALTMEGANIPSHPNGYDENINFDAATQCYNSTVMTYAAGKFAVVSKLGTLNDAPMTGDVGTCDNATVSVELPFNSMTHTFSNIEGDGECFDFDINYGSFAQEGRGKVVDGGAQIHLELFFKDQATGHRCADGAVGSGGITLNGADFTGDAVQVYVVSEAN